MGKFEDQVQLLIQARNDARAELQKAESEAKAAARREERRQQQEADRARDVANIRVQTRVASLRAEGRTLDANLVQIRRHFAERIVAAKRANDQELADRLQTLRRMREAEARANAQRGQGAAGGGGGNGGFLAVGNSNLLRGLGAVAAVAGAADAARGFVDAISHAIAGEFDKAKNSLETTPVFGAIVRLGSSVRNLVTGEAREIERIQEQTRANEERQRANAPLIAAAGRLRDFGRDQSRDTALARASDDFERRRLQANFERIDALRQINDLRNQAGKFADLEKVQELRLLVLERERVNLAQIAADRQQQEAQARAEAEQQAAEDRIRAEKQLADAERRRRQETRRAQEQGLSDQITALSARQVGLGERIARARSRTGVAPGVTFGGDSRFLTGVRERSQAQSRGVSQEAERQIREMEKQSRILETNKRSLEEMLRIIRASPVVITGGALRG